jgi:hypothetical protein
MKRKNNSQYSVVLESSDGKVSIEVRPAVARKLLEEGKATLKRKKGPCVIRLTPQSNINL